MNKIVFITLMNRYSWGGSEELWHGTAMLARAHAKEVDAHVFEMVRENERIKLAQRAGITVYYRRRSMSLKDRVFKRIKAQAYNPTSAEYYWKSHFSGGDPLVVISQGSCYDCLNFPELFKILSEKNFRYVLLNQHNFEHFCLPENDFQNARKIFKNAKRSFFVSKRNLQVVERQLANRIDNAEIIYNPVKVGNYIHFPKNTETLSIASVARLECLNKGQDILLEVLAQQKWKARKLVVNFYGKGPDENYIKSLAVFYGISNMIKLCDHVDNIAEIWEKNACLIMPSIAEGTPLSLLEAMACGRAAVVTDVGGNAEWITEGVNGFIAEAPTAKLLDSAMERMWQNRDKLEEMGIVANQTFTRQFPGDAVAYFYDRLLNIGSAAAMDKPV